MRLAKIQCRAGTRDLLWVSNLQADQLATQAVVIETRTLQRTNRIQLHLVLGDSFDALPAAALAGTEPGQ